METIGKKFSISGELLQCIALSDEDVEKMCNSYNLIDVREKGKGLHLISSISENLNIEENILHALFTSIKASSLEGNLTRI